MNKELCNVKKFSKNYIFNYIKWGILWVLITAIVKTFTESVLEIYSVTETVFIITAIVFKLITNFLIVFFTMKSLLGLFTMNNNDKDVFYKKITVFYIVLLSLKVIYNILWQITVGGILVNIIVDVLIMALQIKYTKYAFEKGSKIPNYVNNKFINNNYVNKTNYNQDSFTMQNLNALNINFQNSNTFMAKPKGISINSIDNNKAINGIKTIVGRNETKICPKCGQTLKTNNSFNSNCGYLYNN